MCVCVDVLSRGEKFLDVPSYDSALSYLDCEPEEPKLQCYYFLEEQL